MNPIRQGDGTGLSVPGFSQVRKGDGTVLWSSGPDIPDSGLLHHHDATQLSLSDGDTVNTWADESGNGNDLNATGTPEYEAGGLNGNPSVLLNGSDEYFDAASAINSSQPNQIFAVVEFVTVDTVGVGNQIITSATGCTDGRNDIGLDTGDLTISSGSGLLSTTAGDADPHIYEGEFASTDVLRLDGSEIISGDAGSDALDQVRIGANCNLTSYGNQRYGEVLVYNRNLSSGEGSDVRSYLSDKWGITI